jgi:hypothetical protein
LKYVRQLLVGNWSMGTGRGCSIWGILPRTRAVMQLHNSTIVGYQEKDGLDSDIDKLIRMPSFTKEYAEQLVTDEWFSQERWDAEVVSLKESHMPVLEVQKLMLIELDPPAEDGSVVWNDLFTPGYYYRLDRHSANVDPHLWILSWQLEIRLLQSIGIGALVDKQNVGSQDPVHQQPPYTLSLAAIDCFTDRNITWSEDSLRLKVWRKESTSEDEPLLPPKTNSVLDPTNKFFLPVEKTILFDFVLEVRKLKHLRLFKSSNTTVSSDEMICPSVLEIENGIGEENMTQFITGLKNDCVMRKLELHPIVMLMSLVAWNEELCCIPLHTLGGFKEFFEFFSLEVRIHNCRINN